MPFTTAVDSTKKQRLLTEKKHSDGSVHVYLKGVASTAAGSVVTFDETGTTTLIAANAIGPVAIANAAVDAATKYGWYMIVGSRTAACDASITDNAKVYIDGTAGRVDDTVVTGDQVVGAVFRGTDTSNLVLVQVDRPFVTDSLG